MMFRPLSVSMLLVVSSAVSAVACGGGAPAAAPLPQAPDAPPPAPEPVVEKAPDDGPKIEKQLALARGGRLFDTWWVEGGIDFAPDNKDTKALDGKGGPHSNGTLPGVDGAPIVNTGHDYRLKNFFGWDLKGAEGIYGAKFQSKPYVSRVNLLTDAASKEEWVGRLQNGFEGLPAYGKVLSSEQIGLIVDFILAVRVSETVGPGAALDLSESAPNKYTLHAGGKPAAGHLLIREKCAGCHGTDGTGIYIDGEYSLGMHGRMKAYESWFKIVNGQPGTKMGPQLSAHLDVIGQATQLRDVLAALCDRSLYPRGEAKAEDVKDGDARCGAALK